MIPSVEQCKLAAANLLGDPAQRKFTDAKLQPFFELAFLELKGEMQRNHVPMQKTGVTYVLPANTTVLTPLTAGISNFGELIKMDEVRYTSGDRPTEVTETDYLPHREPESFLREFAWYGDAWHFIGATQAIQLTIWYYDSGSSPTAGSVAIDGTLPFLSTRLAAMASYPAGNTEMAVYYDKLARGQRLDCGDGLIHALLQPMVMSSNRVRLQLPLYKAQYWHSYGPAMFAASGGGGGDVGAPTEAVLTGTQDGVNDTFTLASTPLRLFLFLNGNLLSSGTAYTLVGATITMIPPFIPLSTDIFRAEVW